MPAIRSLNVIAMQVIHVRQKQTSRVGAAKESRARAFNSPN
ncbi:MAG: hypothetical protein ACRDE2_07345 [Chitinophagaceae bacterium]